MLPQWIRDRLMKVFVRLFYALGGAGGGVRRGGGGRRRREHARGARVARASTRREHAPRRRRVCAPLMD
jgi:hypothetical protein